MNKVGKQTYIIAEIGVNHNGCLETAIKMIDAAKECGAAAVKFQTFTAEALVGQNVPKVNYQLSTTDKHETHFQMIKKLEFSRENHVKAFDHCKKSGIDFISTPYDIESAEFLFSIGVNIFKIASADIVDLFLNKHLNTFKRTVILSTGMSTLGEIEKAIACYDSMTNLHLLQCTSNYPCSDASINLNALNTLKSAFNLPVGFSDHSIGSLAACLSIALGATIVEKHFTLDKSLPGPDQKASSTPEEFKGLVDHIRRTESILGSAIKMVQDEEIQMRQVSRKSLTLSREVKVGEKVTADCLILKRPGTGMSADMLDVILGQQFKEDLPKGKMISCRDIEFVK